MWAMIQLTKSSYGNAIFKTHKMAIRRSWPQTQTAVLFQVITLLGFLPCVWQWHIVSRHHTSRVSPLFGHDMLFQSIILIGFLLCLVICCFKALHLEGFSLVWSWYAVSRHHTGRVSPLFGHDMLFQGITLGGFLLGLVMICCFKASHLEGFSFIWSYAVSGHHTGRVSHLFGHYKLLQDIILVEFLLCLVMLCCFKASHLEGFSHVWSWHAVLRHPADWRPGHTYHTCRVSLLYESACAVSSSVSGWMPCHNKYISTVSPPYGSSHDA